MNWTRSLLVIDDVKLAIIIFQKLFTSTKQSSECQFMFETLFCHDTLCHPIKGRGFVFSRVLRYGKHAERNAVPD